MLAQSGDDGSYDRSKAELFEALGHPLRIKLLQAMKDGPATFSELKKRTGIESSGHLTFHLERLDGLITTTPEGNYTLTDHGREALRVVGATELVTSNLARSSAGTVRVSTILLVGLIVVALSMAVAGGFLMTVTGVAHGAPSSVSTSWGFDMLPGEHHFIFGNGGPEGVSGTRHLMCVVLVYQPSSTNRMGVTVEVDVDGSVNGTLYSFDNVGLRGLTVDSDISLPKGTSQVSVSLFNPSSQNVTVQGAYFTWSEVVHPYEALGSSMLYFGLLVIVVGAVLLARSFGLLRRRHVLTTNEAEAPS